MIVLFWFYYVDKPMHINFPFFHWLVVMLFIKKKEGAEICTLFFINIIYTQILEISDNSLRIKILDS